MVRESSARLLALLGLLQSRTVWTGSELAERLGVSAAYGAQRHRPAAPARLSGRRRTRPGRALPARRRRQAAAAAARRRGGGGDHRRARRGDRDRRDRGDQRPRPGQARGDPAAPAAPPGRRRTRGGQRRSGEHRLQRARSGDRGRAADGDRGGHPGSGRDPVRLRRASKGATPRTPRRANHTGARPSGCRSSPTGWSAGSAAGTWWAAPRVRTPGRPTGWTGCGCGRRAGRGSPRSSCRAATTPRSCCARSPSPAGPCTPGSSSTRRRPRCWPGSTPRSAWSRPWMIAPACWSPAPTAWRSSPSTSACWGWTSTSTGRRSWSRSCAVVGERYRRAVASLP